MLTDQHLMVYGHSNTVLNQAGHPPSLSFNQAGQPYSLNQAGQLYSLNQAGQPYSLNQAGQLYSLNQAG